MSTVRAVAKMLLPLGHLKTGKAGEVEVLLNFSRFFFADFQIIRIFAPTKPTLIGQGGSGHRWNPEATKPFVGQAEGKGVYGRYILYTLTSQLRINSQR